MNDGVWVANFTDRAASEAAQFALRMMGAREIVALGDDGAGEYANAVPFYGPALRFRIVEAAS
jgi:hypothetical protein